VEGANVWAGGMRVCVWEGGGSWGCVCGGGHLWESTNSTRQQLKQGGGKGKYSSGGSHTHCQVQCSM